MKMEMKNGGTSRMQASNEDMVLALVILMVLVMGVVTLATTDHPIADRGVEATGGNTTSDDGSVTDSDDPSSKKSEETKIEKVFQGKLTIGKETKEYVSFDDAIAEAKETEDKKITFESDSSFGKTKDVSADDWGYYDVSGLTIDLGGHTVTIKSKMALVLTGAEGFTVCNGKLEVVKQTETKYISYAMFIGSNACQAKSGDVVLKDLTMHGGVNIRNAGSVTLSGIEYVGENYYSVWAQRNADVVIDDGEYRTTGSSVIAAGESGDEDVAVKVNGGTFEIGDGKSLFWTGAGFDLELYGGFYYAEGGDTGSKLRTELSSHLPDGFKVVDTVNGGIEGYTIVPEEVPDDAVASVTIKGAVDYFNDLRSAVSAAQSLDSGNSAIITLLEDTSLTGTLSFTKAGEYTLDIGSHSIAFTGSGYMVTVGGNEPPQYPIDTINTSAKLTILGSGTIDAQNGTVFRSYGTMVFGADGTGPTVAYGSTSSNHSIFKVEEGSSLEIDGGRFSLKADSWNKVTRIVQNYGTLTIDDGTFDGDIELWIYSDSTTDYTSTVIINGGDVRSLMIMESDVSGTQYEKMSSPTGTFSRVAEASITSGGSTVHYTSLKAAVERASEGDTVRILKETGCADSLNSKSLKFEGEELLIHRASSGTPRAATCTESGLTAGSTCSVCGATLEEQQTIPARGHSWGSGKVISDASERSAGLKIYTCGNCGQTKTETIPKLSCSHAWDSGTVAADATCGSPGTKTFACTKCGETRTESIPATGNHSWDAGTVVKQPSLVESGIIEYKCAVCGQTRTATMDPKKIEIKDDDGVKTTTDTIKTVETAEDGSEKITETTIVSKEKDGEVVEKTETTKSTARKDGATVIAEMKVTERGEARTEIMAVTVESVDGNVKTEVAVSDGSASGINTVIAGEVTEESVAHAIKQAEMAAEAIAEKVSGVSKNISISNGTVTLSAASLGALADSGTSITITGDAGGIEIDSGAAGAMTNRKEDVTISISEKKTGLTDAQKKRAGSSKVIELSAKSATQDFHELGGKAKVKIDMTGMAYENPAVYWLKDDGTAERVDAEFGEGYATIELDHLSLYFVCEGDVSEDHAVLYAVAIVAAISILAVSCTVIRKRKPA